MEDIIIVELYWARDEAAINETDKKYSNYLIKVALNILADLEDSKESVNDTYLKAWNSMPPQKPGILSTYLGKITRQVSIDIFRKRTTQKRQGSEYAISLSELEDCVTSGDNPEQELEVKQLAEKIDEYLYTLPAEARNVFIGRYYFMDSVREVAAYYGISESKTKSMLYRARLGLKKYLEEAGYSL